MRTGAVVIAFIVVSAPGVVLAQVPAAPPTRVCEIGLYGCATHADILATWPAQCPTCQTVLDSTQPSATLRADTSPIANRGGGGGMVAMPGRGGAMGRQPNEGFREQARRNAEPPERFRRFGYGYPPYGYRYQYPNYGYYFYPYGGYYFYPYGGYYSYPYGGYYGCRFDST